MTFYLLKPEVSGGLGPDTIMDRSIYPPRVSRLHYHIEDWMGDDLIESFPCYLCTTNLRKEIEASGFTGVSFLDATITFDDSFMERIEAERIDVPDFHWLRVTGSPGQSDFWTQPKGELVVSQRCFECLKQYVLQHCDVEEVHVVRGS